MKRLLWVGIVGLGVVLGALFLFFKGKRYDVTISQNQIDQALDERFPASKDYLKILTLEYTNPQVTLLPDQDRVRVGLDATINLRIRGETANLGGGATVTTGIRYEPSTQEFYLDDARFERLDVQGVPAKWEKRVADIASIAAKEYLESQPIYRLEATNLKTSAAKLFLKDFEVRDEEIHVTLGL